MFLVLLSLYCLTAFIRVTQCDLEALSTIVLGLALGKICSVKCLLIAKIICILRIKPDNDIQGKVCDLFALYF